MVEEAVFSHELDVMDLSNYFQFPPPGKSSPILQLCLESQLGCYGVCVFFFGVVFCSWFVFIGLKVLPTPLKRKVMDRHLL